MRRLLFYPDLVELGLVHNWVTLNRWIARGFPAGRMVGKRRVWFEDEVFAWLDSQPRENTTPLKGFTKRSAEARRARLNVRLEGGDVP